MQRKIIYKIYKTVIYLAEKKLQSKVSFLTQLEHVEISFFKKYFNFLHFLNKVKSLSILKLKIRITKFQNLQ